MNEMFYRARKSVAGYSESEENGEWSGRDRQGAEKRETKGRGESQIEETRKFRRRLRVSIMNLKTRRASARFSKEKKKGETGGNKKQRKKPYTQQ